MERIRQRTRYPAVVVASVQSRKEVPFGKFLTVSSFSEMDLFAACLLGTHSKPEDRTSAVTRPGMFFYLRFYLQAQLPEHIRPSFQLLRPQGRRAQGLLQPYSIGSAPPYAQQEYAHRP